jgi:hypothetical protein
MNEVAQPRKSVSSTLLLTVFFAIGLVIIVFAVRTFEAQLAEANAAREAEYAAEYAAIDAGAAEETAAEPAAGEAAPAE